MTYAWDFGDESISTAANPSHTYAEALDFTATLTVTDSQGADSNAAVSITVLPDSPLPNEPPIAVAYADILSGTVPLTVNFSSQGSYDPEGGTMTYAWDFGDGSISTAANPSHTYAEALDFTAMLTLTDNQGAEAYDSLSITVLPDGSNGCISYCLISSSIDLTTTEKRRAVTVKGKVFIEDEHGSLIAGATVHGIWTLPDGTSKEQSVDTNQKGIANFRVRAEKGSYTLDIIDTTKTGYSFDPDNSVLSGSIDK
jgi:PKD repeat protein